MSTRTRRWSLRGLSTLALLVLGVVALGAFAALAWSTTRLEDSAEVIRRDMRSLAIADEIALELLSHDRIAYALADAEDPRLANELRGREAELLRLLRESRPLVGSRYELTLIDALEADIQRYLGAENVAAAKAGTPARAARRDAHRALERALDTVDALRLLNEREVEQRHRSATRVERIAHGTAVGGGAVLLLGIVAAALTLQRGVLRPLGALRGAIERYRAGEHDAPIPTRGPREIAAIGSAFEDMRGELARRRAEQLATLAGIAHDLRNPLSPLKQAVALLQLEWKDDASERSTRTLAIVDRQIDHLDRMVSDLLDATRIEAGQLELSLADLDLRDAVREATELHRASSRAHELHVELPGEPVVVRADALRVQQVVGNLLSNAIKYSPDGGPIEVRVEHDAREARVEVRDHGIGISPEGVRELFAPFRRRESAREVAPGSGIGLSVVRRIVEAHGGRMSVESTLGEGSTFVVHLPRTP